MEKKNVGVKITIIILTILVFGLGSFVFYEHVLINNVNNNEKVPSNGNEVGDNDESNQLNDEVQNSSKDFLKDDLKKIIDDQLWILFKSSYHKNDNSLIKIKDISNNDKLLLSLVLLENKYLIKSNGVNTTFINFSSDELEKAFNSSVISNLGIKHKSFDIYKLSESGDIYNRDENLLIYSKSFYGYHNSAASIIKDFKKDGNKYTISMNYLFADDKMAWQYYYGSLTDALNRKNPIVEAYNENESEYIDAQKYLDSNYDRIKDKLAAYKYVFEVRDGKLILTDFSVK